MYINCTDKELFILEKIALAAEKLHVPCYLIGGFVRDKILGRNTKDMDIVCVGDGITLAHEVAALFNPPPEVAFFKNLHYIKRNLTRIEAKHCLSSPCSTSSLVTGVFQCCAQLKVGVTLCDVRRRIERGVVLGGHI